MMPKAVKSLMAMIAVIGVLLREISFSTRTFPISNSYRPVSNSFSVSATEILLSGMERLASFVVLSMPDRILLR